MRLRLLTRAAVGLGLCWGGVALARDLATRFVLAQVSSAVSALPGGRAGSVAEEPGTGRIVLRDLRLARDGWAVSVGRLAFAGTARGPVLVSPADAEAGTVVADDILVEGRRHRYRVPHLEMRGASLTVGDLAALLDAATPATAAERLARVTAAVVTAPSARIEVDGRAADRPGPVITLHDIALLDVVGGRAGAATARSIDVASRDDPQDPGLTTGPVRADLLDLSLVLTLAAGGRADPGTAPGQVFASASVSLVDLHRRSDTGRLTVAAMRSGGVRARPLPVSIDASAALAARPLDRLSPAERRTLVEGAADLAGGYEVDHLEIDGVAFDDGGDRHRSLSLDRLAVDGFGLRRSLSLTLDGLAVDTPETRMSLHRAALWGFAPAAAVDLARRVVAPSPAGSPGSDAPAGLPRTAAALDGLRIVTSAADGTGNSPDGSEVTLDVPEASLAGEATATGRPVTSSAHLRLVFPLPATIRDPNLQNLAALGLKRLDITADEDLAFDAAARRFTVHDLSVGASELGRVAVSAAFGHVDTESALWNGDVEAQDRAVGLVSVERFSVRFANAGLVETSLPLLAASAGVSLPVFVASLKAQAAVFIAEALGDAPAAAQLNTAISAFLDDPRSIGLTVTAPGGLTLAALRAAEDPASLLRGLTIEAYANR